MVKINSVKLLKVFFVFLFTTVYLVSSVSLLTKVEVKKGELRLHFNKAYNKKRIKVFTLQHPVRKVFDIKNARLAHTNVGKNIKSMYCRSIRISQYQKDIIRVVLEVDKPYSCIAYKPLFSYKSYHIPLPKHKSKYHKTYVKKSKSKKVKKNNTKSYIMPSKKYSRGGRIVIDAGHGGHDSGAIGGGKKEKDLVLQIAKRLERQLKKRGYTVYMTRRSDRFLKLPQRTRIADKKDAIVFISIHANSVPRRKRNKIYGIETFFLQNTRDAKSQRIAARENKAVLRGAGNSLSKKVIIDSVLNGPKIVQSNKLAIDVQKRILTNLRRHYRGIKDGGVRSAPFWVLVGASRPSILVEVGYISHPRERKRLFTPAYQEFIAKGIAEGVNNYLNNRKKEIEL